MENPEYSRLTAEALGLEAVVAPWDDKAEFQGADRHSHRQGQERLTQRHLASTCRDRRNCCCVPDYRLGL
jgi:hypothetical protein